jgi:hypothetical protein
MGNPPARRRTLGRPSIDRAPRDHRGTLVHFASIAVVIAGFAAVAAALTAAAAWTAATRGRQLYLASGGYT